MRTHSLDQSIDCVVYIATALQPSQVERSLLSLYAQSHRPHSILLAGGQRTCSQRKDIDVLLANLMALPDFPTVIWTSREDSSADIGRGASLNRAIKSATGDYLVILNGGDVLYGRACETLLDRLHGADAAIAIGNLHSVEVDVYAQEDFVQAVGTRLTPRPFSDVRDLLSRGDCPYHIFLVDRARLPPQVLHFDESLQGGTECDFLVRAAFCVAIDFSLPGEALGEAAHLHCPEIFERAAPPHTMDLSIEWDVARLEARKYLEAFKAGLEVPSEGTPIPNIPTSWRPGEARVLPAVPYAQVNSLSIQAASDQTPQGSATRETLGRLDGAAMSLQLQITRLMQELRDANARALNADSRTQQLMQAIAETHGSTSWRLTAPLRWAADAGRNFPHRSLTLGRLLLRKAARAGYRYAPLNTSVKGGIAGFIYSHMSGLFRDTQGYARWQRLRYVREHLDELDFRSPHLGTPDVTIIIPAYGQLAMTVACLRSIATHRPAAHVEVMVVEDASGDPEILQLQRVPGLVFHVNAENLGFLRSCNEAVKRARGKYVCLLNNDTEVEAGWLDSMLTLHEQHPNCGMVGSKLIYPDGQLQEAGGIIWNDGNGANYGRLEDPTDGRFNYVKEVDYCSGACILIATELFLRMGGFDELYLPAYYEDTDLAFRIRESGLKVLFQPASRVIHHEGQSHGTDVASGVKAHQSVNQRKFFERWKHTLEGENFPPGQKIWLARDRSGRRKTILVVDHAIPQPDRDAGSRSTFSIINTLLVMGMSVKFWPHDLVYNAHYAAGLEQRGVEIIHGAHHTNALGAWLWSWRDDLDYILFNRPLVTAELIPSVLANSRAKRLYYGHDLHYEREAASARLSGDTEKLAWTKELRALETGLWTMMDAVYYPSHTETETVLKTVPTATARTLPLYALEPIPAQPLLGRARNDILFVAGFAHAPNVDGAEWFVREVFSHVLQAIPSARLILAGSNPSAAVRSLASSHIQVTGYLSDAALETHYRNAGVAVVPLRYGAGVKGKVVEALHHGLPLITTPVGAQGLRELEVSALVCDTAQAMAQAVIQVMTDDASWHRLATAGPAYTARFFSSDAMRRVLEQDIDARPYSNLHRIASA